MPPAARITDIHVCGIPVHNPPNPIVSGSGDTIVGFLPAARVGDTLACGDAIVQGSANVIINNRLAARLGDSTAHGGKIIIGYPTVIIGESGQSSTLKLAAKNGTPFCEECEKARRAAAAAAAESKAQPPADSVTSPPPNAKTPPPEPQVVLKGVKLETVALAASNGDSNEQRAARAEVARAFYAQHAVEFVPVEVKDANGRPILVPDSNPDGILKTLKEEKWVPQPISPAAIRSHIRGIDFSKPLFFGPQPPMPEDLEQWQAKDGRQGNYYAHKGTQPGEVGIHHSSAAKPGAKLEPKVVLPYKMNPNAPYLRSYAGPINDHWSVYRRLHHADGGGVQYMVPDTSHAQKA